MARTQTLLSTILDFLMSHTSWYYKFVHKLEIQMSLDSLDDVRRLEIREIERLFFKNVKTALKNKDLIKINSLLNDFEVKKLKDYKLEDYYESSDDNLTLSNFNKAKEALERTREDSFEYEKQMLKEGSKKIA